MESEKWGTINRNGTSTGAMGLIIDKKADLTIGKFAMTSMRNEFMTPSISYFASPLIIVVPRGEPYTSLEKLTKPFRDTIWTAVLAILAMAVGVIALLQWKFNEKVQNFVFGEASASPYLNTLSVFLGGSLTQLPTRNFARTILCCFMLYCLVVRNAYTGALYNFIRSKSLSKPTVDSIDEMVEKDFKFHMLLSAQNLITAIPKVYDRRVVMNSSEVPEMRRRMTDPYFKAGMLSSLEQIVYFNQINGKNFTLDVCSEHLFTFQYTIYFQKHSYLTHYFDLQLLDYQTNGIIENVVSHYSEDRNMKAAKSPKALELHQVMGSFWLLFYGLALASIVAAIEVVVRKVRS